MTDLSTRSCATSPAPVRLSRAGTREFPQRSDLVLFCPRAEAISQTTSVRPATVRMESGSGFWASEDITPGLACRGYCGTRLRYSRWLAPRVQISSLPLRKATGNSGHFRLPKLPRENGVGAGRSSATYPTQIAPLPRQNSPPRPVTRHLNSSLCPCRKN